MTHRIFRGMTFILLLLPWVSRAGAPLSWDDCVAMARAQHPGLIAARQSVTAAEAAIRAARSGHLPQLSAGGRASYTDDSRTADGTESYQGNLDLEQSLYDGGSTRAAVRTAQADREVALAEARQTETDILYDVRLAFADLLYAQAQIGLLEQIRARRADNVEMVELRYLGGQEHQGSLALNQASLREAEVDLAQARRGLSTAQAVLARTMGLADERTDLVVTGRYEDVQAPGTPSLAALARTTPSYLKAEAALARAQARLDNARSGRQPVVSAYGTATRYGDSVQVEEDSLSAGVRITLPLWEGGQTGAEIRQAAAQRAVAEAEVMDTLNTQRTTLEQALLDYENAGDAVAVQQQFLTAQELRATIAREQYGNGLLKFDNWDIIENDLISRQKSLLESRRQAFRAEAGWWRATGRGLESKAGEQP